MSSNSRGVAVGTGAYQYDEVTDWPNVPDGLQIGEVVDVCIDGDGRITVLNNKSEDRALVFSQEGELLGSWGRGVLVRPHGLFVGPDGSNYCADMGTHTVGKFPPDGRRSLLLLGKKWSPSETGVVGMNPRTVKAAGPPFNHPTDVALGHDGSIYVSDGYGNARIHKFSPQGELLFSWGSPGSGPGEFCLPHGVSVDDEGRVYVADRENNRIQIFTGEGEFLTEWTDCSQPCQVVMDGKGAFYVPELSPPGGRVSIFDERGTLMARWEVGGQEPRVGAHGMCVTPDGDLYVGFVTQGAPVEECVVLRKYLRRR